MLQWIQPPFSFSSHHCAHTCSHTDTLSSLNWAPLLPNIMPICYHGNPRFLSLLPPTIHLCHYLSKALQFFPHCGQHETGLVVSAALCSNSLADFFFFPLNKRALCFWSSRLNVLVWLVLNQPFFFFFFFSPCVCTVFWARSPSHARVGPKHTHKHTNPPVISAEFKQSEIPAFEIII